MKCQKCFANEATRLVNGLHVCDSCAFLMENAQCYKCQMYLPKTELVMWRGQLYCQYCLQDLRDEEIRKTKAIEEQGRHYEHKGKAYTKKEVKLSYCENCGRALYTVYIVNGKKLCKTCSDKEVKKLKGQGVYVRPIRYKIREEPVVHKFVIALATAIRNIIGKLKKKVEKEEREES